jgi:hypothetical protein
LSSGDDRDDRKSKSKYASRTHSPIDSKNASCDGSAATAGSKHVSKKSATSTNSNISGSNGTGTGAGAGTKSLAKSKVACKNSACNSRIETLESDLAAVRGQYEDEKHLKEELQGKLAEKEKECLGIAQTLVSQFIDTMHTV